MEADCSMHKSNLGVNDCMDGAFTEKQKNWKDKQKGDLRTGFPTANFPQRNILQSDVLGNQTNGDSTMENWPTTGHYRRQQTGIK